MATSIDIRELPDRFAELIAFLAGEGGEVVVTEQGRPRALLRPLPPPKARLAGLHAGAIQVEADFDDPLPDEFWTG